MQDGAALALEAIRFLAGEAGDATASRVALINNPLDPAAQPSLLERTLSAAQRLPSRRSKIVGEHRSCCPLAGQPGTLGGPR